MQFLNSQIPYSIFVIICKNGILTFLKKQKKIFWFPLWLANTKVHRSFQSLKTWHKIRFFFLAWILILKKSGSIKSSRYIKENLYRNEMTRLLLTNLWMYTLDHWYVSCNDFLSMFIDVKCRNSSLTWNVVKRRTGFRVARSHI